MLASLWHFYWTGILIFFLSWSVEHFWYLITKKVKIGDIKFRYIIFASLTWPVWAVFFVYLMTKDIVGKISGKKVS